jgi:hypothetical protein
MQRLFPESYHFVQVSAILEKHELTFLPNVVFRPAAAVVGGGFNTVAEWCAVT